MRRASSASRTCGASWSASEYTATVGIPRRRAVRITRQAISPRLAMSSLRNTSGLPGRPGRLALLEERNDAFLAFGRSADLGNAPGGVGHQRIIHRVQRYGANQALYAGVRLRAARQQVRHQALQCLIQL